MRQHRRSGPLDAREGALMYLLRKYVRQAGAAPLPEPSQPSDPATRWAGDLRGPATLTKAVLADGQSPPSPALWLAMSVGVLKHNRAGKIPMSETMGIERLGRFPAGCRVRRGGGMGVKNYTSISCHRTLTTEGSLFKQSLPIVEPARQRHRSPAQ